MPHMTTHKSVTRISGLPKSASRLRKPIAGGLATSGKSERTPSKAINPKLATNKKVTRQFNCVLTKTPSGTPMTVATVNPAVIVDSACPRLFSGASVAATVEALGLYKAALRAAIIRATISIL